MSTRGSMEYRVSAFFHHSFGPRRVEVLLMIFSSHAGSAHRVIATPNSCEKWDCGFSSHIFSPDPFHHQPRVWKLSNASTSYRRESHRFSLWPHQDEKSHLCCQLTETGGKFFSMFFHPTSKSNSPFSDLFSLSPSSGSTLTFIHICRVSTPTHPWNIGTQKKYPHYQLTETAARGW